MKSLLFNIIVFLSVAFAVTTKSCNGGKEQEPEQSMYGYEMIFNQRQLDSLFVADTLECDLNNWISTNFVDYETNEKITKYMYTKHDSNVIYTVFKKNDTLFVINKIIIKTE